MNITAIFIRHPVATFLLMAGILLLGIGAYPLLPVSAMPDVEFPTISVTAQFPGASPDTMASSVAAPLEQQFAGIQGVTQMTSSSMLGATSITLQFELGRNIDGAAADVQTAISAANGVLPKDLPNPPTYRKLNPADRAILVYAVYSSNMPTYKLDEYVYSILAQKLSTISGIAQVTIGGQQQYAAHVQVNPSALASRGIGLEDIRAALGNATLDEPKGTLEGEHQTFALDTNDQLFNARSYENVIVAYRNGIPVRIGDVGHVIDSSQAPKARAYYRGGDAELLQVMRQPGANAVTIIGQVKAMMPLLRASIPPSVHIDLVSDRSQTIRASINDVEFTMGLTIALVVMVIFLFLRTFWATIIPSVTVPLSLIATFGVLYLCGYSLDNLSLMGLTISVGFVVDDAIVMIENIVKYIEDGETPFHAALKGARQVSFTIISITFSLCAVFIPLLFMSGVVGRLVREFAVTVTAAVIISAFVSLSLTPVMCSVFLKREQPQSRGRFYNAAEDSFQWMIRFYERGLQIVFRHQLPTLLSTLVLMVLAGILYWAIPKGFFPEQDTGFVFATAQARQDVSFKDMADLVNQFSAIILDDPAVGGAVGLTNGTNSSAMMFQLKNFDQRNVTAQEVIQRLRPKIARVEGGKFFMQAGQDIIVGGRPAQTEYQYTLTDTDIEELNHWASVLEQSMAKLPVLQDVATDQQIASPHVAIEIDRDAAYRLGLSLSLIDQTLYDAFGQRQVATIYTTTNQYKVILEVEPKFQKDASSLSRIYIPRASGPEIPLSAVAHFLSKVEPLTVNHQGKFPSVTLSFNLAPGVALSQAIEEIAALRGKLKTPPTLQGDFQGSAQAFESSLSSMPWLIAAAILTMYIVLGMLYGSYIHPITILSALPSAGVGALIILMAFGYDLSIIALIGIILLIGIVKKNAIMMIDFALVAEREGGKSPTEAIHEACLRRFRPIMMTTLAALFGSLPLALGSGAGSELRRPLGVAIVGGLVVSQLLTLYTTPVIYLYLDRLSRWLGMHHHIAIPGREELQVAGEAPVAAE